MLGAMECPTQWACSARHSPIPISHSLSHPARQMQGNPTPLAHTRRPAMLPWRRVSSTIPPAVPAPIAPACIPLRANGSAGSRAYRSIPDLFSFFPLPLYNQFPPISPPTFDFLCTERDSPRPGRLDFFFLSLLCFFFFLLCRLPSPVIRPCDSLPCERMILLGSLFFVSALLFSCFPACSSSALFPCTTCRSCFKLESIPGAVQTPARSLLLLLLQRLLLFLLIDSNSRHDQMVFIMQGCLRCARCDLFLFLFLVS